MRFTPSHRRNSVRLVPRQAEPQLDGRLASSPAEPEGPLASDSTEPDGRLAGSPTPDRRRRHAGRHRLAAQQVWQPAREVLRRAGRGRTALVSAALAGVAFAAALGGSGGTGGTDGGTSVGADVLAGTAFAPAGVDDASAQEARLAEEAQRAEEERLAALSWYRDHPVPVAGLNDTQMINASKIVQAGQAMGLSPRAYVIAIATAMQESNLYNLASTRVAESRNYAYEGFGSDHDSVGLFQQRASGSWGKVRDLMDPGYSATAFYRALVRVSGWESMALTRAAQRVQVSAYPNAYAKHESRAQQVVDALLNPPVSAP